MNTTLALAQLALQLMPLLTVGTTQLFAFIGSVRTAAQQTGEWSDETEALYQKRLLAKADAPAAQPDQPA